EVAVADVQRLPHRVALPAPGRKLGQELGDGEDARSFGAGGVAGRVRRAVVHDHDLVDELEVLDEAAAHRRDHAADGGFFVTRRQGRERSVGLAYAQSLRCRECRRECELAPICACEWCVGPLEASYGYDAIGSAISREKIAAGPASMWRYADLLPVDRGHAVDLGAGFTPLVRADRLAAALGLGEVWVKNDTLNPTNSFKDRVASVALSKALEFGFKTAA